MKNIESFYPLSPMQQGILFHSLYASDSGMYCDQFSCNIQGDFNSLAFQQAWQQLVEHHPILRTSFVWEGLKEPTQIVHNQVKLLIEQHDWRLMTKAEQEERIEAFLNVEQRGFALSQAPLMRLTLIRLADTNYLFIWCRHHLLLDGWSASLLLDEVFKLYNALNECKHLHLEKPRAYRDYIAWLQQQDLRSAEAFWRRRLQGFTSPTSLGVQKSRHRRSEDKGYEQQQLGLSIAETAALQSWAKQQHLTLSTVMHGAWAILLSRYSGEEDVVFGSVVSGRGSLAGSESMVGVLINTLPMRVYANPKEDLLQWLKQLQTQQNETRYFEYCPLVEIQKWSDVSVAPLFESILNFQNYPIGFSQAQQVGFKISDIRTFIHPHYPLTASVKVDSELLLEICYNRDHFEPGTISRMLGHFRTLLLGMIVNQQQYLADLPLLTEAECHQQLEEWNSTQADYPQVCIHQLFEAQVERTPNTVAVVFDHEQLTYQELNARANQLAHHLQVLGVGAEVLVGICIERSLHMIVALLGILKAGGAYVPLDPAYPHARLAFMLEDAQVSVLLTQQNLLANLPKHQAKVVCLDTESQKISQENSCNPIHCVTTENLAYVIYTSGSTGKPKGVQIPHGAVVNFLSYMRQTPGLTPEDTLLSVTTLSFDIAALELYLPLIVGARLVIVNRLDATDGTKLLQKLTSSSATVMQATPATWRMLLAAGWQSGQLNRQLKILCGGEALNFCLARQLLERSSEVWNLYGPTETTIWSVVQKVSQLEEGVISIGRPIANTQLYILDQHQKLVPVGVMGELHIGGAGVARGYLNRPQLTAQKFIPHPFHKDSTSLLYKTGDLARHLPDGTVEFLGRIDNQVKLRGFRIELGEIETLLNQHPAVHSSVVVVREDEPGDQRLVAYVVFNLNQLAEITELRRHLQEKLPSYMVPSVFVQLETLPITPNGKLDRRALPEPDGSNLHLETNSTHVLPRHPVEELLVGIWQQVLGVPQVGIYDNFFELGGHSLLATQVVSRVRKTFEIDLPLQRLFESPTVAALAIVINSSIKQEIPSIKRVERNHHLPLSFAQTRLWLLEQLNQSSLNYNEIFAVQLVGLLDIDVLEQSINEIVRRHEVLRTSFSVMDGQPFQVITPDVTVKVRVVDLLSLPSQRQLEVQQLIDEESLRSFNLTKAPLLRCTIMRASEREHIVLFTIHHIVSDAWSIGVFVREFAALYTAFESKKPSPLPELPIQYADFAVWQHQWLQGKTLETLLTYWKKQLGNNLHTLQLPTARKRTEVKTNRGASQTFVIPSHLSQALQTLSRQEGVTLFMTLLASFQVLLQRYTNQDDIVVGTDIANRNRAELEPLIGFFVNLLVLRTYLGENPSFRELLKTVRSCTLEAYAHQDLPFDQLVKALQPERNLSNTPPLFQVLFVLQNAPMPALELPGLTLNVLEVENKIARFDLALFLTETEQGILGKWQYNADLFDSGTIARMTSHFQTLLGNVVVQPNARINTLEMFTEAEKKQQNTQKKERQTLKREKFINIVPKTIDL
ncbi:amino acid adenylation domain protein [Calothrix sp. NIES-4071]|nr:amino acid adenylation domain protein [Calothrix sp. NIES-4071]BAZ57648.1 amino acid adenylation domain protein [Calothrix sp. NIES-4105]